MDRHSFIHSFIHSHLKTCSLIFREGDRGREGEGNTDGRQKHPSVTSYMYPDQGQNPNIGMCSDQGPNPQPKVVHSD